MATKMTMETCVVQTSGLKRSFLQSKIAETVLVFFNLGIRYSILVKEIPSQSEMYLSELQSTLAVLTSCGAPPRKPGRVQSN